MNRKFTLYIGQILILAILLPWSRLSWAGEREEVLGYLQRFHNNPLQAMERLPQEIINGRALDRGVIDYKDSKRISYRRRIQETIRVNNWVDELFSLPLRNDLASSIIEPGEVNGNIEVLDRLKLTSAELTQIPWADSYWPMYKGLIGIRYGDAQFPDSKKFMENYNYIVAHPAGNIVASGNSTSIDQLSPAEKYDLLVGDANWTLTGYAWSRGKSYFDANGYVPTWMGICHGWSGAAHMGVAVPRQPIRVRSITNIPITFYSSDIKALQSMLWANASPATRFVGAKCRVNNPAKNAVGRILDPDCLDTNPATFHLTLTNQLGIHQRSFVMDATYDLEVWNFPLSSYRYKYFNPQTLEPTLDFRKAVLPIKDFTIDKFKEFRAPEASYVVGIVMDDTYVVEIQPGRGSQQSSPVKTYRHIYDLELNSNFEILGGEWYANAHPDFIWTYDTQAVAKSVIDDKVNPADWVAQDLPPAQWTGYAQTASARGQPILGIINALLSREGL